MMRPMWHWLTLPIARFTPPIHSSSTSRRIARRSRISGNTDCHSADGLKPGSHGMQMEIEPADEPIDLLGRHGERRTQEDRRAIVVDGDPRAFVPEAFPNRLDPPPCGRQFAALAPPVPEQLQGDQEALASHVSHQGRMVLSKAVEFRAQAPPDRSASLDQSFRLEDPDDLPRGGAAERVPAKR